MGVPENLEQLEKRLAGAETPQEQVDALLAMARLLRDGENDLVRARESYDRILAIDPTCEEASRALETLCRQEGRWDRVVELLVHRVDTVPDTERAPLLQEAARIYETQLSALDLAFVTLVAAFKQDPQNAAVLKDLERVTAAAQKWNELLTETAELARDMADPGQAAELWTRIGGWYGEILGHLEYATTALEQALARAPRHRDALVAIASLYRRAGRFRELASVLGRQVELLSEDKTRVPGLLELADLYESQLGETQQAINTYERVLTFEGENLDALESLDRLYRRTSAWDALVEVLKRKAAVLQAQPGNTTEVVSLKVLAGEIWEEKLLDADRAIALYREALVLDPNQRRVLVALERLYDKAGRSAEYIDVMQQQLEMAPTDEGRIAMEERLAAIWEESLGRVDRAAECYERIVRIDGSRASAWSALERLCRQMGRVDRLAEILQQRITLAGERTVRAGLYSQLGQLREQELHDTDGAISAFAQALQEEPENAAALVALARLYEKTGQWERLAELTSREAAAVADPARRAALFYRLGQLAEQSSTDLVGAEQHYAEALAIDPSHGPSLAALATLYRSRGDWLKARDLMVRAAEQTHNLLEKTRLLYDAATLCEERLRDQARAESLYEKTLQVDPEHVGAAAALGEMYFAREKWADLERVLDVVVRKSTGQTNAQLAQAYFRLGRANEALGHQESARCHTRKSYELDASSVDTAFALANLCECDGDWQEASRLYQSLLVEGEESVKSTLGVDVHFRLGRVRMRQGEPKRALAFFEQALLMDPTHQPSLESLLALNTELGDFGAIVTVKRAQLERANVESDRFRLLMELGVLYQEKLENQTAAIEMVEQASALRPEDRMAKHRLLNLYTDTKQWKNAVGTILYIAEREADPLLCGKYHYSAAVIYRDELLANAEAVEQFDKALACFFQQPDTIAAENMPGYLKAFQAIDRILTQTKDWTLLQRAYRRMLKRMPDSDHELLRINLWHNLGEICRTRLNDYASAASAFEAAAQLDPKNETRQQILAELYGLMGSAHVVQAAHAHHAVLRQNPACMESYRALYRIYAETGQKDKAWCVAASLAFLRKAEPQELKLFEHHRAKGLMRFRGRLSDEVWVRHIFHPDQDRWVSAIFALVAPAVYGMKSAEPKGLGLDPKKERVNVAAEARLFPRILRKLQGVFGVGDVELYEKPDQTMGLVLAATKPTPSFVVGKELMQGRAELELAFWAGRQLAYLRPEHVVRQVAQTRGMLKSILLAGIKLVEPEFAAPASPELSQLIAHFKKTLGADAPRAEQLAIVVKKFLQARAQTKDDIDLGQWMVAVDITALRAGLIACGDLETAARVLSVEPASKGPHGAMSAKDKVKELLLYHLSEGYFEVRKELGIGNV